jgi:hypothetical protein
MSAARALQERCKSAAKALQMHCEIAAKSQQKRCKGAAKAQQRRSKSAARALQERRKSAARALRKRCESAAKALRKRCESAGKLLRKRCERRFKGAAKALKIHCESAAKKHEAGIAKALQKFTNAKTLKCRSLEQRAPVATNPAARVGGELAYHCRTQPVLAVLDALGVVLWIPQRSGDGKLDLIVVQLHLQEQLVAVGQAPNETCVAGAQIVDDVVEQARTAVNEVRPILVGQPLAGAEPVGRWV